MVLPWAVPGVVGEPKVPFGATVVSGAGVETNGVCGISGLHPRILKRNAGEAPCQVSG